MRQTGRQARNDNRRLHSLARIAFHRSVSRRTNHVIELRSVSCARIETGISSAVHAISLELAPASVTVFTGAPGCGKNLILRLLGLLEKPDAGAVIFQQKATSELASDELHRIRDTACGYVFCPPFLLPKFSVMENIAMPLFKVFELPPIEAQQRTEMLTEFVQLAKFTTVHIEKLHAGLQLRVGLARALGALPPLVVVEEPDRTIHGEELAAFRKLLHDAASRFGCAIAISAGPDLPPLAGERRIECVAGKIVCDAIS
jgi:ABC-type lipoprotein export system ATPase subunit